MTITNGAGCGHSAGLHSPCPVCRQDDVDRHSRDHHGASARELLNEWERRTDALLAELTSK